MKKIATSGRFPIVIKNFSDNRISYDLEVVLKDYREKERKKISLKDRAFISQYKNIEKLIKIVCFRDRLKTLRLLNNLTIELEHRYIEDSDDEFGFIKKNEAIDGINKIYIYIEKVFTLYLSGHTNLRKLLGEFLTHEAIHILLVQQSHMKRHMIGYEKLFNLKPNSLDFSKSNAANMWKAARLLLYEFSNYLYEEGITTTFSQYGKFAFNEHTFSKLYKKAIKSAKENKRNVENVIELIEKNKAMDTVIKDGKTLNFMFYKKKDRDRLILIPHYMGQHMLYTIMYVGNPVNVEYYYNMGMIKFFKIYEQAIKSLGEKPVFTRSNPNSYFCYNLLLNSLWKVATIQNKELIERYSI
ncbi:hypothetical protein HOG47_03295 [archaeon]|nr:hypothetical protein [archaeon]MBT4022201.1 hypothetical protein [archaeon]MBT4272814.1 hypothetical protein [archaeon]MBT6773085.1 hypothetical protein [archaeon]